MSRSRRIAAVLAALAFCGVATAQERTPEAKLEMRLRLKAGETYRLKTTIEQRINQAAASAPANAQAKPQATEQVIAVGYGMTVQAVDASGNMKVATRYDSVLLRQKGPAGAVEYDSAKEPKQVPQAARPFAALVGLGFTTNVTPTGQVTAVEGLDEMFAAMVRKLELPEGPARAAVEKALSEQFGADAMKQTLQNLFGPYPDGPVAVGESWRRRVTVSKGFPVVIESEYTLAGRDDGVARVAVKATLSPNEAAGPVDLGTGKMTYELRGEQSGTAEVDEATGWTRSLATTQTLAGTLRFQGGGGVPETTSPVTIQEKVTVEAVK